MTEASAPAADSRRRQRIERELRALQAMQAHMNMRDIVLALLTIPALALLCFAVGWKLHFISNSLPLAITAALGCGALIWWIGRHWFTLALVIVIALLIILFEDLPVDQWPDGGKPDRKTARRLKLEQAIAKRETLLRSMKGA